MVTKEKRFKLLNSLILFILAIFMLFDTFSIAFQAEAVSKAIKSLSDPAITETTAVSGGIKLTWSKDKKAKTTYVN